MANVETQKLDSIISSRRALLTLGGAAIASLAFTPKASAATITDADILNFALNLEYLEAQFYTLAYYGVTIDKLSSPIPTGVNGGTGGTVTLKPAFTKVPFNTTTAQSTAIGNYAMETAIEEGKHVLFLQAALNKSAVSMPNIDLYNSFNTLAAFAGIGPSFDPFSSDINFLLGAYIFEDVGVTAYKGAAGLIADKSVNLPAAAGILAVEAYHAGLIRTTINQADAGTGTLTPITKMISDARSKLANGGKAGVDDLGITTVMGALNGTSATYPITTIADVDANSLAYSRTTTQVLSIVTAGGTTTGGVTTYAGGFYPAGLNGTIK